MEAVLRKHLPGGQFQRVSAQRSRTMSAVKSRNNRSTERRLRFALVKAGVRGWRLHYVELTGKPDFYFPQARIAVFVDGCFWHGCSDCGHIPKENATFWRAKIARNRQRDLRSTHELRRAGIRVIRLWEHDVQNDVSRCIERIQSAQRDRTRRMR